MFFSFIHGQNSINLLFCFLKINLLRQESACHKILIKSDAFCDKTEEDDDFIISIGQDKDRIEEIITSCLEEPLHRKLQKWTNDLKRKCVRGNASDVIAEVEAIRKKMVSTNSRNKDIDSDLLSSSTKSIVPDNVKKYLFR